MGAKYTAAQNAATQKYQKENYARLYITCQKDKKTQYEEAARAAGMSLNAFILMAVEKEIRKEN